MLRSDFSQFHVFPVRSFWCSHNLFNIAYVTFYTKLFYVNYYALIRPPRLVFYRENRDGLTLTTVACPELLSFFIFIEIRINMFPKILYIYFSVITFLCTPCFLIDFWQKLRTWFCFWFGFFWERSSTFWSQWRKKRRLEFTLRLFCIEMRSKIFAILRCYGH